MKRLFIIILTILTILFMLLTSSVYGAHFYSGIKFQNTPSNGDIVTWTTVGNQFRWTSRSDLGSPEVYGSSWDSNTEFAQKNNVYDWGHGIDPTDDGDLTNDARTYTAAQTMPYESITILTSVPGSPVADKEYCFNNDTADPCNIAGTDPYCAVYDGSNWHATRKTDGTPFYSAIPHHTYVISELNDYPGTGSSPVVYQLTMEEVEGTQISNNGLTDSVEFHLPTGADGINVVFLKKDNYGMAVCPYGSEQLYFSLSGAAYTQLTAGQCIENTTNEISKLVCISDDEGDTMCSEMGTWVQE